MIRLKISWLGCFNGTKSSSLMRISTGIGRALFQPNLGLRTPREVYERGDRAHGPDSLKNESDCLHQTSNLGYPPGHRIRRPTKIERKVSSLQVYYNSEQSIPRKAHLLSGSTNDQGESQTKRDGLSDHKFWLHPHEGHPRFSDPHQDISANIDEVQSTRTR
jgi:hypothetical protein